jgi:methionine synthase II (cobalamin-independent)
VTARPAEPPVWPAGTATGVGSLPGDDYPDAMASVLDELPDFPHLVELPERGPWAGLAGRGVAHLVDLPAELGPSGWRLATRPGGDDRRARQLLERDLDVAEELRAGSPGPFKLAVAGPWTLAASVELPRGERVLADAGAVRDLTDSLAAGLAERLADARRRFGPATLYVQLDEPALPAVLAGAVPTASGFSRHRPVDVADVRAGLAGLIAAVTAAGATGLLHCCAAGFPIGLAGPAGAAAISLDLTAGGIDEDALAEYLDGGGRLLAGVVPALDPPVAPSAAEVAEPVRVLWRRLGLPPEQLSAAVTLTPVCGLAGASRGWARDAMRLLVRAAGELAEAPEPAR